MIGPSTNYYVGSQSVHYTIPKRLIYYVSDHARMCLEGSFAEASANAVRLSDVDPETFQWLWHWLYTGKLGVFDHYCGVMGNREQRTKACLMLCRVHHLAERLLFDSQFFDDVQENLERIIADGEIDGKPMMLSPEIVGEVLLGSWPVVRYEDNLVDPVRYWSTKFSAPRFFSHHDSLTPYILGYLCTFEFCTTANFHQYADYFVEDGAFVGEIMAFMANETSWAIHRWGRQVDRRVDIAEVKRDFAYRFFEEQLLEPQAMDADELKSYLQQTANAQPWMETPPRIPEEVWSSLKAMCTSAECTTDDFRDLSPYFGMDAEFTGKLLGYMATELSWVIYSWSLERHEHVDWAAEKAEEKREEEREEERESIERSAFKESGWWPNDGW